VIPAPSEFASVARAYSLRWSQLPLERRWNQDWSIAAVFVTALPSGLRDRDLSVLVCDREVFRAPLSLLHDGWETWRKLIGNLRPNIQFDQCERCGRSSGDTMLAFAKFVESVPLVNIQAVSILVARIDSIRVDMVSPSGTRETWSADGVGSPRQSLRGLKIELFGYVSEDAR
jgi:hypothetical protein